MNRKAIKLGSDVLIEHDLNLLKQKKVAVLAHSASICSNGVHIIDMLVENGIAVEAVFGPEHGLQTNVDYMKDVRHSIHSKYKIPVYSLYGNSFKSLSPKKEMFKNIDVLICDLQDVGSRYYTYVWTLILCMKVCANLGVKVVVCDRPNPINGVNLEGNRIEKDFESFVGLYSLPNRHAMTIGEIANHINKKCKINAKLTIIKMNNWERKMFWSDTNLNWIKPSPSIISETTALVYTGMCLLEGTNISEGRGTEKPFEIFGAPYFNSNEFIEEISKIHLAAVKFDSTSFVPTKDKFAGVKCNGVEIKITDKNNYNSYLTGLAIVWVSNKLYKNKGFKWRTEPYEFIKDIPAIDLLTGSNSFRSLVDGDLKAIKKLCDVDDSFIAERKKWLFYD